MNGTRASGVVSFDHREISSLPEYVVASKALDALAHALQRGELELGPQRWLDVVREMAAALPYADQCPGCTSRWDPTDDGLPPAPAPERAQVDTGSLDGAYRCPRCGHRWTCWWAVDSPAYF